MWEIVAWKRVFSLALVPAAFSAWFVKGLDAGFLALTLSFLWAYPLRPLLVWVLMGIITWTLVFALDA